MPMLCVILDKLETTYFMRKIIQKHKKKIVLGAPIIAITIFGLNIINPESIKRAELSFQPIGEQFVNIDQDISVAVKVETTFPINVVGMTVNFPADLLEIIDTDEKDTIINLWAEKAVVSNEMGTLKLGGGIIGGFIGNGKIITIKFKPKSIGMATLDFNDIFVHRQRRGSRGQEYHRSSIFMMLFDNLNHTTRGDLSHDFMIIDNRKERLCLISSAGYNPGK